MVHENFSNFLTKLKGKMTNKTLSLLQPFIGETIQSLYTKDGQPAETKPQVIKSFVMDPDGLDVTINTESGDSFSVSKNSIWFNSKYRAAGPNEVLKQIAELIRNNYIL
jgi:hypothetical protein